jgi:hypothetical protein
MPKTERRRSKRYSTIELDVFNKKNGEKIGQIINLSLGGMLIVSNTPIQDGLVYNLSIPFEDTASGPVDFDIQARCVWCTNTVLFPKYSIGMEFLDDSPIHYTFIKRMIDAFTK